MNALHKPQTLLTVAEIEAALKSHDYNAELLLMHAWWQLQEYHSALEDIEHAGHVGYCRRRAQRAMGK